MTEARGVDFGLDGYELSFVNRQNKSSGGVAIFVEKSFNFMVLENMTTAIDDLVECVTVEIWRERHKHILVSCIYRAQESNIDTFRQWMEDMYSQVNNKPTFLCGDFNINLIYPKKNQLH